MLLVEVHDLGKDGKGRIIYHHAVIRIVIVLIIATGEERPDYRAAAYAEILPRPLQYGIVHLRRGVAVVCGALVLEFVNEIFVRNIFLAHILEYLNY